MKKLKPLVIIACLFSSTLSFAQESEISADFKEELERHVAKRKLQYENQDRDVIEGWMSYTIVAVNYLHSPSLFQAYGRVITPDALPAVVFGSGAYDSGYHGFGQMFDPTAEAFDLTDQQLSAADPYLIDSIGLPFLYNRANHNGIDDTLLLTIGVTDRVQESVNPYYGLRPYEPSGDLVTEGVDVLVPGYEGTSENGFHYGLTGEEDLANNVHIQQYKFPLTEEYLGSSWKQFPVHVEADGDQIVYVHFDFKPSFDYTAEDTAWVFPSGDGEPDANGFYSIYYKQGADQLGYFFDLSRGDGITYSSSFQIGSTTRYAGHADPIRNTRLDINPVRGYHIEYHVNAFSSVGLNEEDKLDIDLYPNPTTGDFSVTLPGSLNETTTLQILNIAGKEMFTENYTNISQINLNSSGLGLVPGIYLMNITSGNNSYVKRLIIQ